MRGCSGGACVVAPGGGMRGFIRGVCMVLFGGACMVSFGGKVWFIRGVCVVLFGGGMCGFIRGACVVLFGGHVWFYLGGVRGFFSFFGYNEIRSMSGRYASYWNAFLLRYSVRQDTADFVVKF